MENLGANEVGTRQPADPEQWTFPACRAKAVHCRNQRDTNSIQDANER